MTLEYCNKQEKKLNSSFCNCPKMAKYYEMPQSEQNIKKYTNNKKNASKTFQVVQINLEQLNN